MPDFKVKINEPAKKELLYNDSTRSVSVCAYCRVSTDKSDQKNSLDAQKRFFAYEFDRHPNWYSKTIFADEGISGTSLKKRDQFNLMISEAKRGKYQLIVTKEISRFSRNLQDLLNIVGELREKGVYIYFMAEDINTESDDYRDRMNTYGNQAEAESAKTSRRVKWGQLRQMENGVVFGRREMYGYNIVRDQDGKQRFEIIPAEAEVVRRIYDMYASGIGTFKIAKKLEGEGIPTKRGKNAWSNTAILRMLRNEKYVGDLTTGKTYTPNYLTHQKKYNRGESTSVSIENHHSEAAIVDRELWNRVQALLLENTISDETKLKHSNRYWCSGKVFCGVCGERYISQTKKQKKGMYKSWICWQSHLNGQKKERILESGEKRIVGCTSHSVNDRVLQQGMYDIVTQIIKVNFDEILDSIKNDVLINTFSPKNNVDESALQKRSDDINQTLANLTVMFAEAKISEAAYSASAKKLETELQEISDRIAESRQTDISALQAEKMQHFLDTFSSIINLQNDEINTELYSSIVDKIVVCEDYILKYYFVGLSQPFVLRYSTSGRGDSYTVNFELIKSEM
ncbi:MAG: recombinase family protein [Firmicutes bacterium]|nr:recombinase family protein [Bacillota bacterium]